MTNEILKGSWGTSLPSLHSVNKLCLVRRTVRTVSTLKSFFFFSMKVLQIGRCYIRYIRCISILVQPVIQVVMQFAYNH